MAASRSFNWTAAEFAGKRSPQLALACLAASLAGCGTRQPRTPSTEGEAKAVASAPLPVRALPAQDLLKPPAILKRAREALAQGYLERAVRWFELATAHDGKFDRSEQLAALTELGAWEALNQLAQRVRSDPAATSQEREAALRASDAVENQGRNSSTPELLLEAALNEQPRDAVAARKLFDRARVAFERKRGISVTAELNADVSDPLMKLQFTADSRRFALASSQGYDLWSQADARLTRRVRLSAEHPVALSPDGNWFADATRLFDQNGKLRFQYPEAVALTFSPDSATLIVSPVSGGKMRRLSTADGHVSEINGTGFSDVSWCDKSVVVLDDTSKASVRASLGARTLRSFADEPLMAATCVGANSLATCGVGQSLKLYAQQTGRLLHEAKTLAFASGGDLAAVSASRDGAWLLWSSISHAPVLFDTRTWAVRYGSDAQRVAQKEDNPDAIFPAVVAPDGASLVEVLWDTGVRVRQLPSTTVAWQHEPQHQGFWSAEASPDGSLLLGKIRDGFLVYSLAAEAAPRAISVVGSRDYQWLSGHRFVVWTPGLAQIIDAASGRVERTFPFAGPGFQYTSLLVSSADEFVVRDAVDKASFFVAETRGPASAAIRGVVIATSNGSYASRLGTELIVHARDGKGVNVLAADAHEIDLLGRLLFSPDEHFLTRRTSEGLALWNVRANRAEQRYSLKGMVVKQLFSEDGKELKTLTEDGTIRVFNVASGALLREFGVNEEAGNEAIALGRSGWHADQYRLVLRSTANRILLELVLDRDKHFGFLRAPDGRVESLDATQPPPGCALGTERFPWSLCEGRLAAHELLSRAVAGEDVLASGI